LHPPPLSTLFPYTTLFRSKPIAYTPPVEESEVFLATDSEAREGYGVDSLEHPLEVGLLKNGGEAFAGRATLDLDYLLGENGGHRSEEHTSELQSLAYLVCR